MIKRKRKKIYIQVLILDSNPKHPNISKLLSVDLHKISKLA